MWAGTNMAYIGRSEDSCRMLAGGLHSNLTGQRQQTLSYSVASKHGNGTRTGQASDRDDLTPHGAIGASVRNTDTRLSDEKQTLWE